MNRIMAVFSILWLMAAATVRAEGGVPASAEQYVAPYVQMQDFSGNILIAQGGKTVFSQSYGMANFELAVPNSARTRFLIASLSKTFTAAAIGILEKEGKLKLSDPLAAYVAGFPAGDKITISHLLAHASGVRDFYSLAAYEELKEKPMTPAQWLVLLRSQPLDFEPGTNSSYSNSGYFLLAEIIEKTSGKSYEAFLTERIFNPLGMKDTGFWSDVSVISDRATGYDPWVGGAGVAHSPYYDKTVLRGGGSIYSTTGDLLLWYRAVREKKLFDLEAWPYPYGWGKRQRFDRDLVEQDGSDPGFVAHISAYLKDDLCIIILGNVRTGAINRMKEDLAAIALGKPYAKPAVRERATADPSTFAAFAGTYEISKSMHLSVRPQGNLLLLKGTGGSFLPLEPLPGGKFFFRQTYATISFTPEAILWDGMAFKKLAK